MSEKANTSNSVFVLVFYFNTVLFLFYFNCASTIMQGRNFLPDAMCLKTNYAK